MKYPPDNTPLGEFRAIQRAPQRDSEVWIHSKDSVPPASPWVRSFGPPIVQVATRVHMLCMFTCVVPVLLTTSLLAERSTEAGRDSTCKRTHGVL